MQDTPTRQAWRWTMFASTCAQGQRGRTSRTRQLRPPKEDHCVHRTTRSAVQQGVMVVPPTMTVSLDQWATSQAPLSESERRSVNILAEFLEPPKGQRTNNHVPQPSDQERSVDYPAGPSSVPSRPTTSSSNADLALPAQGLVDAPSYLSWYSKQQSHIFRSMQSVHVDALQNIKLAADEADELLSHIESSRVHISELRAGARLVEEGSEDLREEAERMVEKIVSLMCICKSFLHICTGAPIQGGRCFESATVILCNSSG